MTQCGLALDGAKPDEVVALPREFASRAVQGLTKGGRVLGMTKGQFSLLDLIRAVLEKTGPAHVQLSTWTAGIRDVQNVGLMLDDSIITGFRLLVDRSFPTRKPAYCAAVRRVFGPDAIRMTNTHAKIALIRNERWAIAIRSSMNLNRNPRFEQFDVDDSLEIWEFFNAHFEEMSEQAPEGLEVPNADIQAVFDRVGRGVSPFQPPCDVPADMGSAWVKARSRETRISMTKVAKAVGVRLTDMLRRVDDPSEVALREDVVREFQ